MVPLKWIDYGVHGDLIVMCPKPYSLYSPIYDSSFHFVFHYSLYYPPKAIYYRFKGDSRV